MMRAASPLKYTSAYIRFSLFLPPSLPQSFSQSSDSYFTCYFLTLPFAFPSLSLQLTATIFIDHPSSLPLSLCLSACQSPSPSPSLSFSLCPPSFSLYLSLSMSIPLPHCLSLFPSLTLLFPSL